jgi:hypothetical protein
LYDGRCYYFDFLLLPVEPILKEIVPCATNLEAPPITSPVAAAKNARETEMWIEGSLSNFEYLLFLNRLAGRTFSDPTQYPVFPWVLADYAGEKLDLSLSSGQFRDLSRPVDPRIADSNVAYDCAPVTAGSVDQMLAHAPFGEASSAGFTSVAEMHAGGCREIIPEFFYFPDFLNGVTLPPWASSPLNFVYQHRHALESVAVSLGLHAWIDLIFGCRQRCEEHNFSSFMYDDFAGPRAEVEPLVRLRGQLPMRLFGVPHSERRPKMRGSFLKAAVAIESELAIELATISQIENNLVCTCVSQKTLHRFSISPDDTRPRIVRSTALPFAPSSISAGRGVVLVEAFGDSLAIVEAGPTGIVRSPAPVVTSLASSEQHIAVTGTDMRAHLFDSDGVLLHTVPSYRGEPACVAIGERFGIFACATVDGSVMVCSLASGAVLRVARVVSGRPSAVLVSPAWGFVAVWSRIVGGERAWAIDLFSINATPVGRTEFKADLAAWNCAADAAGFDWAIVALTNGNVFRFELALMECGQRVGRLMGGIVAVTWVPEAEAIAAVLRNGKIMFLPCAGLGER